MPAERGDPFEHWPPSERLTWIADSIAQRAGEDEDVAMLAWADVLTDLAKELEQRATITTFARREACPTTSPRREQCDRPPNHRGGHSWETDRYRRRAEELEGLAARTRDLQRQVSLYRRRAFAARSALAAELSRRVVIRRKRKPVSEAVLLHYDERG
jgi:hypothetical protein